MRVSLEGQVTLPQKIIDDLEIIPGKTEIDFLQEDECWYLVLANPEIENPGRFRTAHKTAKLTLSSEKIMTLTRNLKTYE